MHLLLLNVCIVSYLFVSNLLLHNKEQKTIFFCNIFCELLFYLIYSSRVSSNTLIGCNDSVFKGIIKQQNIDIQVFNGGIKDEIIDEKYHHNDSQVLKIWYELNLYCHIY